MDGQCTICGNARANKLHAVQEMMFGYREAFEYLECGGCGCLQIVSPPADMGRYYGENYYSVAQNPRGRGRLYDAIKRLRTRAFLGEGGLLGRVLLRRFGPPGLLAWVKRAGVRQDSRVLEVGCGSGALLKLMQSEGFTHLTGADPFIAAEINHGRGLKILKAEIASLKGEYDFIVLEHAFEHIPAPHETIKALRNLLVPGGMLIIAVPLVGWAWQHYGVNWIQLDAPRHLYLHSERSFRMLAKDFQVEEVVYDSGAVQFWGSEQYLKDIPLMDKHSHRINPGASMFTPDQIKTYEKQAADLNAKHQGDQAVFYLRKPA